MKYIHLPPTFIIALHFREEEGPGACCSLDPMLLLHSEPYSVLRLQITASFKFHLNPSLLQTRILTLLLRLMRLPITPLIFLSIQWLEKPNRTTGSFLMAQAERARTRFLDNHLRGPLIHQKPSHLSPKVKSALCCWMDSEKDWQQEDLVRFYRNDRG